MQSLGLTLPSLAENLALDEALLLEAEASGGEVLRCWEWPSPGVVLGAAGVLADDVDETACQRDGVPILRRASGGGTVLLGSGCLLFSLILSYERDPELRDVTRSYRFILDVQTRMLSDVLPGCALDGSSDLAWRGRKFSGNAQQRKRNYLLHHGTLLYGFDLASVSRYLRSPLKQPAYRQGRVHADFLMNVPLSADGLIERLRAAWGADTARADWPADAVARLVEEKYGREEWTRRR